MAPGAESSGAGPVRPFVSRAGMGPGGSLVYIPLMRPYTPATLLFLVTSLVGCKGGESASHESPPPPPSSDAPADAKADAGEPAPSAEDEKAQAEAAQWNEGLKELEAEYAAKKSEWTPERQEAAKKALSQDFKDLDSALAAVLKAPFRSPENVERDQYRHPKETLEFFGLTPQMSVLEISPGTGWYSEILAPVLASKGKLVHIGYEPNPDDAKHNFFARAATLLWDSKPELYAKVEKITSPTSDEVDLGEPESYDMVLVFRMMHNFVRADALDHYLQEVHQVLKPNGVLAVVQHRAAADGKAEDTAKKGYLPEAWLIEAVESKGFKLAAKSEVNANPKDTKDYEKGVWTLPPSYALEDKDKEKYSAIGESDRMTLKFVKVDELAKDDPSAAPGAKTDKDEEKAAGG